MSKKDKWGEIEKLAGTGNGSEAPQNLGLVKALKEVSSDVEGTKMVISRLGDTLDRLQGEISTFNKISSKLQYWLIGWTAIIAVATFVNLFV